MMGISESAGDCRLCITALEVDFSQEARKQRY